MRVHELAKELGFENKEFIDRLKKVGVDVKSHLSGLSDDQEKSIRDKMKKASAPDMSSKKEPSTSKDKVKSDNHIVKEKIVFNSVEADKGSKDVRTEKHTEVKTVKNNIEKAVKSENKNMENTVNNSNKNFNHDKDNQNQSREQDKNNQNRSGQNRDGQNRNYNQNRDNQNRDGQNRGYNQNRDNQNRDGQNRGYNQNRDNQNRDGQNRGYNQNRDNQNRDGQNRGYNQNRDNQNRGYNQNRDNQNRDGQNRGYNQNRDNQNRDGQNRGYNQNRDNQNRDGQNRGYNQNRDNQNRDGQNRGYNQNRDNQNRDGQNRGYNQNRDNQNRDGQNRGYNQNRDNQNRDGQNRGYNQNRDGQNRGYNQNRDNQNRDGQNRGYNQNRDNQNRDGQNRGYNQNRDNQNRDGQNRGYNQNRDNQNRDGQNRGSGYGRDQGNRSNDYRGNKDNAKGAAAPAAADDKKTKTIKPSVKKKFDKKKYEEEKRKKDEERKLSDIRSDFRKEDKKKKFKKRDKTAERNDLVRAEVEKVGMITIGEEISIKELAEKLGLNLSDIIKKFFMMGKILTANAILNFEEAEEVAMEYDVLIEKEEAEEISYGDKYELEISDKADDLVLRPPVITIMGHVDHGKTSLLDSLRKTHIMDDEAGGITQKIGAYQIKWKNQKITFIDTPGHEAFTEMRSRGAKVTDIAILIVAADDGVKPQTVEAISHAKEAGVPIIVAINKIDKPDANPMKVKQELLEYGLIAPEWGGQTEFVEISAKNRINLEELLETITITAELLELKANPKKRAKAVVIESRLDPKMGAVADILIQEGSLKIGDIFVAGESHGRVRSMVDDRGSKKTKASLSEPVEITGFNNIPEAGDVLYVVNNDKQAKKIVEDFLKERKQNEQNKKKHISLESLSKELEEQQLKELKCIIRADSKGSVEALRESLEKLSDEKVMINIIQASSGAITEGDVKLAEASDAIIIGFNVRPTTPARNEAEKLGVEIRTYNVIYHITEEIEKAMKGLLDPEFREIYNGRIEVQKVFKVTGVGNIAGAVVVDGKVLKDSKIRVLRDGIILYEGEIGSLKRFKDDAKEVINGQECGIGIKDFNDIKEGDLIEAYVLEEIPR
ncbi:translation initiation factor IF-2 [Sebaldella sp. S0638]|uniref:translation initiation factor IF-2 n=1 Tax=Sebaldella sp. S0638 TaxID=2957809 RepID=UPI0035324D41